MSVIIDGGAVWAGVEQTCVTASLLLDDAGGSDERVGERGLAVIDVGDDGHVADLLGEVHDLTDLFDGEVDHVMFLVGVACGFFFLCVCVCVLWK